MRLGGTSLSRPRELPFDRHLDLVTIPLPKPIAGESSGIRLHCLIVCRYNRSKRYRAAAELLDR